LACLISAQLASAIALQLGSGGSQLITVDDFWQLFRGTNLVFSQAF